MSAPSEPIWVVVQGGGDLASGVALRMYRCGLQVMITELPQPLVVRRMVAFAEAVFDAEVMVEGVRARLVSSLDAARKADGAYIPVRVDPELSTLEELNHQGCPVVLVDARMTKQPPQGKMPQATLVIGLGPGFIPGENCHAAIETNRGHRMGRALWSETTEADTGIPENVVGRGAERVLRAPANGPMEARAEIGAHVEAGQVVAEVSGQPVRAAFSGVVRGLVRPGLPVTLGLKIGDIDPRNDPRDCFRVSDKSLAVGGGVIEAILSRPALRPLLWVPNR